MDTQFLHLTLVNPKHKEKLLLNLEGKFMPMSAEERDQVAGWLVDMTAEEYQKIVPSEGMVQCILRAGEFIYFPRLWMHQVRTFETSVGVGGYITR
jgi:Cupin-like domain